MAPVIRHMLSRAPYMDFDGMTNSIPAINSAMPVPMRPKGSVPKVEKICTDVGWAVNL